MVISSLISSNPDNGRSAGFSFGVFGIYHHLGSSFEFT